MGAGLTNIVSVSAITVAIVLIGMKNLLSVFLSTIMNSVFSSIQYFELSGYFLFNLDISDGSFRTIIIRRYIWMIEKGKDMITIFDNSLLKRDHLFVLWVQRLLQETLQLIFQVRSEFIRIVIESEAQAVS